MCEAHDGPNAKEAKSEIAANSNSNANNLQRQITCIGESPANGEGRFLPPAGKVSRPTRFHP